MLFNTVNAFELGVGSAEIHVGDSVEVPVYIMNATNATGLNFTVYFDPSVIRVDAVNPVDPAVMFSISDIDNLSGEVMVALVINNTTSLLNTVLLNLTVYGLNPGYTLLDLSGVEMSNETFQPIYPSATYSGWVEVIAPEFFNITGNAMEVWNRTFVNLSNLYDFRVVDVNGDGADDLVFLAPDSTNSSVYVLQAVSGLDGSDIYTAAFSSYVEFWPENVDPDDGIEFVVTAENGVFVVDDDGDFAIAYLNSSYYFYENPYDLADVDGDGYKELIISGSEIVSGYSSGNYTVFALDYGYNNVLWSITVAKWPNTVTSTSYSNETLSVISTVEPNSTITGYAYPEWYFDFDGDTKPDVVITWGNQILAVDGETGDEFWSWSGIGVRSLWVSWTKCDVDGDGAYDVIFEYSVDLDPDGLWPPEAAGIGVINATGSLLMNYTMPGYTYTDVDGAISDINGNGHPEILAVFSNNSSGSIYSAVIDGAGGDIIWGVEGERFEFPWDFDGDGFDEVMLVNSTHAVLRDLNGNLEWSYEWKYPAMEYYIFDAGRVSSGGSLVTAYVCFMGFAYDSGNDTSTIYVVKIDATNGDEIWNVNITLDGWLHGYPQDIEDVTGDSIPEYLFGEFNPYWRTPTTYALVDGASGEILWRMDNVVLSYIGDFDGNQIGDVIYSTDTGSSDYHWFGGRYASGADVVGLGEIFNITSSNPFNWISDWPHWHSGYDFSGDGLKDFMVVEFVPDGVRLHLITIKQKPDKPDLVGYLHTYDEFGRETDTLKVRKDGTVYVNATYEIRNLFPDNPVGSTFKITATYRDGYSYSIVISSGQLSDLNQDGVLYIHDAKTVSVSGIDVGCYTFTVEVDSDNVVDEMNEANNVRDYTICLSKPDLVPFFDILDTPVPDIPLDILVGVVNQGDVWADATKLSFVVDGVVVKEIEAPMLDPGESWHTVINYTFTPGIHQVSLIADANNDESELDESNNITSMNFSASLIKANATAVADTDSAIYGDIFNVSVLLNTTTPLGDFDFVLSYDRNTVRPVNVASNYSSKLEFNYVRFTSSGISVNGSLLVGTVTFRVVSQSIGVASFNVTGSASTVEGIDVIIVPRNDTVEIEKYVDITPIIYGYMTSYAEGETASFYVAVRNLGGVESNPYVLNVSIYNSTGLQAVLVNETRSAIPPYGWDIIQVDWDLSGFVPGGYWVTASVNNDTYVDNNVDVTDNITIAEYNLDVWAIYYPWKVIRGSEFYIYGYINSSHPGMVNVTLNLSKANGLKVWNGSSWDDVAEYQTSVWNSKWNWYSFRIRAEEVGKYGNGTTKEFVVSVEARSKSDVITSSGETDPDDYVPDYPLEVYIPLIELNYFNSTMLSSGVNSSSMIFKTIDVNNVTTANQSIVITVLAGQEGRTLRGLDYLVHYPYGCVEQTTSAMLGALHVDWYYREKGGYPSGYNRDFVNDSVIEGVKRLAKGGVRGQHDNGAWSMWGSYPPGHLHYTIIASYGLGRVAEDSQFGYLVKGNLSSEHSSSLAPGKFNFNDTIYWLNSSATRDGNRTYWAYGYVFGGDIPSTAVTMVAMYQLSNESLLNASAKQLADELAKGATNYLLSTQNTDGGWSNYPGYDSNAKATALVVWALKLYGMPSNDYNRTQIEEAINRGIEWLLNNYYVHSESGGVYWGYPPNPWWDSYGQNSFTTAYTLIALNESRSMAGLNNFTSLNASDETIIRGVKYLTSVYRSHGSFGYTQATQAAVHALTLLQTMGVSNTTLLIDIDDGAVTKIVSVNSSAAKVVVPLTYVEIDAVNSAGVSETSSKRVHTVSITRIQGSGTVIVSIENVQEVAANEVVWGSDYFGNRILAEGGTVKVYGGEVLAQDELTVQPVLPDNMVEGKSYEAIVRVVNNNGSDLVSPIITVPLGALSFDTSTTPKWTTDGVTWTNFIESGLGQNFEYDAVNSTLNFFPDVIPGNGWIEIRFNVTVPAGNVTLEARVTPMYNESVTYLASTSAYVAGFGNISLNMYYLNGTPANNAQVELDGSQLGTVSTIKALEGPHRVRVNVSGYVPVEFDVLLSAGETRSYTVVLAKPDELGTPKVLFAEGVLSYSDLASSYSLLSHVKQNATAEVKAMESFNLSLSGTGKKVIAVAMPKIERGSLYAWLDEGIEIAVNGNATSYWFDNSTGTLVVMIEVSGGGNLSMGFEGRKLGAVDPSDDRISIADIQAIARYLIEERYPTLPRESQWTSLLWGY